MAESLAEKRARLEQAGDGAQALYDLCVFLQSEAKDPKASCAAAERAHRLHPGVQWPTHRLLELYSAVGKPELGVVVGAQALRLTPDPGPRKWVYDQLARAQRAAGQPEAAEESLRQAKLLSEDYPIPGDAEIARMEAPAVLDLCDRLERLGRHDQVIRLFGVWASGGDPNAKEAEQELRGNLDALLLRGRSYRQLGLAQEAFRDLRRVIAAQPRPDPSMLQFAWGNMMGLVQRMEPLDGILASLDYITDCTQSPKEAMNLGHFTLALDIIEKRISETDYSGYAGQVAQLVRCMREFVHGQGEFEKLAAQGALRGQRAQAPPQASDNNNNNNNNGNAVSSAASPVDQDLDLDLGSVARAEEQRLRELFRNCGLHLAQFAQSIRGNELWKLQQQRQQQQQNEVLLLEAQTRASAVLEGGHYYFQVVGCVPVVPVVVPGAPAAYVASPASPASPATGAKEEPGQAQQLRQEEMVEPEEQKQDEPGEEEKQADGQPAGMRDVQRLIETSVRQTQEALGALQEAEQMSRAMAQIESRDDLYAYYEGFLRTFSRAYTSAQVIAGGQFQLNNNWAAAADTVTGMIPLIGGFLGCLANAVAEGIFIPQVEKRAHNVQALSPSSSDLNDLIKRLVLQRILRSQEVLARHAASRESQASAANLFKRAFLSLVDTVKDHFSTDPAVPEGDPARPTLLLGTLHASALLSGFVAQGKLVECYRPAEKLRMLNRCLDEVVMQRFEEDNDVAWLALLQPEVEREEDARRAREEQEQAQAANEQPLEPQHQQSQHQQQQQPQSVQPSMDTEDADADRARTQTKNQKKSPVAQCCVIA